jgi:hypothetical protein
MALAMVSTLFTALGLKYPETAGNGGLTRIPLFP